MLVTFTIPDGAHNPVPSKWTPEEVLDVLNFGALIVQHVQRNRPVDGRDSGRTEILSALKGILDQRVDEKVSAMAIEKVRAEEATATARVDADRANQAAALAWADNVRLRESHTKEVADLRTVLVESQAAVQRLTIPAIKGSEAEKSIQEAVSEHGMYAYDTSQGKHNIHYHDLIMSTYPLEQRECVVSGFVYDPPKHPAAVGTAVRCSVESKFYNAGRAVPTHEVVKFARIRTSMLNLKLAECFLFVSNTRLAGSTRKISYEWIVDDDGVPHLTCYLTGDVVTRSLIADVSIGVCGLQKHAEFVFSVRRLNIGEANTALQAISSGLMASQIKQIQHLDTSMRNLNAMHTSLKQQRVDMLQEVLFATYKLRSVIVSTEPTAACESALDSLIAGEVRNQSCTLIKDKQEYFNVREGLKRRLGGAEFD